ncbi:unnamed protein product [Musa acuminata subsp. burmannicoides]
MGSSDSPLSISSSPNPREMREEESEEEEEEEEIQWRGWRDEEPWPRKSGEVMLEGYVDAKGGGEQATNGVARTKSLTDDDLEELKGCLDLGFGFSYEEIPDLCNTLPALELCYSMSQRFLDEKQQQNRSIDRSSSSESLDLSALPPSPPIANWKFSSPGKRVCLVPSLFYSCEGLVSLFSLLMLPGDDPDEVKARLRYWAQAVAFTLRLCKK